MKRLLTTLLLLFLFSPAFDGARCYAQGTPKDSLRANTVRAGTANAGADAEGDEFNVLIFAVIMTMLFIVVGATLAGSMAACLVMMAMFGMVSVGILSAGILVGFYRRSVTAGFKTVLGIGCSLLGIVIGAVSFYFINRIFHIHLSAGTSLLIGGFSGLLGGLLMGLVIFTVIRIFLNYCRQKLKMLI